MSTSDIDKGYPADTVKTAEAWIKRNALTGTLTPYPVDVGTYDWAIGNGTFSPSRDDQKTPDFISRFSSASMEHYHYTDGSSEERG
jgi:hypothetical protein